MGIHRVKEATSGDAIRTRTGASRWIQRSGKTGSVIRSTIATDDVITRVSDIRIIDSELRVVEEVERFHAKLGIAALRYFEVLQKVQVKVDAMWIVQKVTPGIPERQPPWRDEHIWVSEKRTETFRVMSFIWRGCGISCQVGVGARTCAIRDSGVVQDGDPCAAPPVNNTERRARLKDRDS